jgi:membrane protein implicated in regulation of membrane protease activity
MKDASLAAKAVTLMLFVLVPGAAFASVGAPELDPGMSATGLALLGGTAAFLIERYRRRTK